MLYKGSIIMSKKKILFVIPEYSHGGTNKSLENILSLIDHEKYDINIWCLYEDGAEYYKDKFRPYIVQKSLLYTLAHDNVFTRKIMGGLMKICSDITFSWLYKREATKLCKKEYDTVIAFQEGLATEVVSYFTTDKIAWVHFNYATSSKGYADYYRPIYNKYDKIICVSKFAADAFKNKNFECKDKTTYLYNLINSTEVFKLAEDTLHSNDFDNSEDCFKIISIGRLNYIKQFEKIPYIVSEIKKRTFKSFKWYIIGNGEEKETIEYEVSKYKVEKEVILLGAKNNPYPYIKSCNLLVSTSLSESCPYVVIEAKTLGVPIVCSSYPTSKEMVNNEVGWICNINDMPSKIADIINDKNSMYSEMKESIAAYSYNNEEIMSKFYKLID